MKPLVSVVIPAYNSAAFITETVDSVLQQTYPNLEVLVIDDGSTDNTREVLKPYEEKIEYYRKDNGGPASARNFGIRKASGVYVAFLDADDLWKEEKIDRQVKRFDEMPGTGLVHTGSVQLKDGKIIERASRHCPNGNVFKELFSQNFIGTSTVLVRKECFQSLGLFDTREGFMAVEDYDMWLRIARKYRIEYIAEGLVYYRVHAEGISRNIDRSYLNEKRVIEEAISRWPQIKEEAVSIRKRMAVLYENYGTELLEYLNLPEARQKLMESLKYFPLKPDVWIKVIKTWLPLSLFKWARKIKRKERT